LVTRIKIKNILHKEIIVVTDTISDMLTRIRNANMVKHQIVQIPATKMSLAIAEILKEEGFIEDFESYKKIIKILINFIKIYWKISKTCYL
jgi:ribosomal protein S8